MEVFEGTIRLAGDAVALPAVLLVDANRLKVSARQQEIGDWELSDVTAILESDGCHVAVEGEELVVTVPELIRFAEAIGPHVTNPGNGSLRAYGGRPSEADDPPPAATAQAPDRTRSSAATRAGVAAGLTAIALAIWAPLVLVGFVLLVSLAGLLLGAFAVMDPYLAVRIPDPVTPALLFSVGVGGVIIAIGLAIAL